MGQGTFPAARTLRRLCAAAAGAILLAACGAGGSSLPAPPGDPPADAPPPDDAPPPGEGRALLSLDLSPAVTGTIPVTLGQVFAPGDVGPDDHLYVHPAGDPDTAFPTQVDARAWHPDGSLRHAVLTAEVPVTANVDLPLEIYVSPDPTGGTPISLDDLLASAFEARIQVRLGGTTWSADAVELLSTGTPATWLEGPLVSEWLVDGPLKDAAGNPHPHLQARFAVRAYRNTDYVRVSTVVENAWTYEPDPSNLTYDVDLEVCGRTAWSRTALTHYHHARWRKVFWCGPEPKADIRHDTAYLIDSKAVPGYDRSLVVPEEDLAAMEADWAGDKTEPMGVGLARSYMPGAGAAPDIGPLPRWAARYLLSQDPRAKTPTLGTADLAGSWSIHYRDRNTGLPVSMADYPYVSLGRYTDTYNPDTGQYEGPAPCGGDCSSPYTADNAHQPDLVYLPYLVTGDHYYLEELLFWANYNMISLSPGAYRGYDQGLFKGGQMRAQAWSMRTLAEAAFVTPDDHPLKQYFVDRLHYNLAWYNDTYSYNPDANGISVVTNGYALDSTDNTAVPPWQQDFFTWAIGHTLALGFEEARPLLEWHGRFPVGRMTDPGFCWIFASEYDLEVRDTVDSPIYDTFAQVYEATVAPEIRSLECASQAMADALGLQPGEMVGYSQSATGYPSNLQPALAVAAEAGLAGADTAWSLFDGRSVKPNGSTSYEHYPNFAIVPRP